MSASLLRSVASVRPGTAGSLYLIRELVAQHTGVSAAALSGTCRARSVVAARHLAMKLCSSYAGASSVEIGRAFNRHHTAVLHALRKEVP